MSTETDLRRQRTLPRWLPYAILAVAAAFLVLRWDTLPERWVSHWAPGGVPNGWSYRNPGDVFGPLLLAVPVLFILEIIGSVVLRRAAEHPHLRPLADATLQLLRLVGLGLSCFFAFLAIALPLRASIKLPQMVAVVLGLVVTPAILGMIRVYQSTARLRSLGAIPKGYTGLVYRNSDDPRLWVPKLLGLGMTINFAHRWAWVVAVALVVGPFILAGIIVRLVAYR